MFFATGFIAAILDRILPIPPSLWGRIGHPVQWMGWGIDWMEGRLNLPDMPASDRRRNGTIMLQVLVVLSLLAAMLVHNALKFVPGSILIEALIASVFLAHRDLAQSVRNVAFALGSSLEVARKEVSNIVGRDTTELDEAEISRAAIESLAENSSDGLIAPLFWLCLFGLPGIVVYKAINTADSMVGHKSDRFLDFGRASAQLDDLVNWVPARLTGLLFVGASFINHRADARESFETMRRDAPRHVSPNAGWPEAAMAGALNFGLGGPRAYKGETLNLPRMGNGRRDLKAEDIHQALRLFEGMSTLALAVVLLGVMLVPG